MTEEKNILITQEGCGHCEEAKETLDPQIRSGTIEVVPIESRKGFDLANKYSIEFTPTILNGKDGEYQKCMLKEDGKTIECDNGTTKEL